uniref:Uncharacterized protein n=1 Tax=Acrobeloides nanus TaxID=290746 RepID=A0A914CT10_9BILA
MPILQSNNNGTMEGPPHILSVAPHNAATSLLIGISIVYLGNDNLEQTKKFICPTEHDAVNMKCRFSSALGYVNAGKDLAYYQFKETVKTTTPAYTLSNGEIILQSLDAIAQLKLTITDLQVSTVADINTVEVKNIDLHGCYSCDMGATVIHTCLTDFGTAMAHLKHPSSFKFYINCNTTGITQTRWIYPTKAEIDEKCDLTQRAIPLS